MTSAINVADRSSREWEEPPEKQRNRNWAEILQELRVVQTGVQLLTAFLLAIPFQSRFDSLTNAQEWLYLAAVLLSVTATGLLVMPVSLHRAMFRKQEKETLIRLANRIAQAGLATFALAVADVMLLIFDVTKGMLAGVIAGGAALVFLAALWAFVPAIIRSRLTE